MAKSRTTKVDLCSKKMFVTTVKRCCFFNTGVPPRDDVLFLFLSRDGIMRSKVAKRIGCLDTAGDGVVNPESDFGLRGVFLAEEEEAAAFLADTLLEADDDDLGGECFFLVVEGVEG
ncbi:MAG: hypothetical protein SGARI_005251 [Bacillariaceae sp.]